MDGTLDCFAVGLLYVFLNLHTTFYFRSLPDVVHRTYAFIDILRSGSNGISLFRFLFQVSCIEIEMLIDLT